MSDTAWKKWECIFCGHVYSEEAGDPKNKVPPGTRFEDLPESWFCPNCGAHRSDFDPVV